MAEEEQLTDENLLRTGTCVPGGYDNIDKSEVGKQSDNGNQALPSSQCRVLPVQSTWHTPEENKSLLEGAECIVVQQADSANKNLQLEPHPADDACQEKNYDYTGKGKKSDFSLWKLTFIGETVLLKFGEKQVSLPTTVTPSDNPKLYFEGDKASLVAGGKVFEISLDEHGTLTCDMLGALQRTHAEDSQKEQTFDTKTVQNDDKEKHCFLLPDSVSNSLKKQTDETASDDTASGNKRTNETLKGMSSDATSENEKDRTLGVLNYSQDTDDGCPKIQSSRESELDENGLAVEHTDSMAMAMVSSRSLKKFTGGPLDTIFSKSKNDKPNSSGTGGKIEDIAAVALQVSEGRLSCSANQQLEMTTIEIHSQQSAYENLTKKIGFSGMPKPVTAPADTKRQQQHVIQQKDVSDKNMTMAQYQEIEKRPKSKQQIEQSWKTDSCVSKIEKESLKRSNIAFDNSKETEILKASDQKRQQKQLEQKVADLESTIEGLQRLEIAERGAAEDGEKNSDGSDNGNSVPVAHSLEQLSEDFPVSPVYELIVEDAKQRELTKDLFSGVEITFEERAGVMHCIMHRKRSISDSVVSEIKNLQKLYGTRDLGFKDIRSLSDIPEEGHLILINELIEEMKTETDFLSKVDIKRKKLFIAAGSQADADSVTFKIRNGLGSKSLILDERTSNEMYATQLQEEIHRTFSKKVATHFDVDGRKIQLIGLKNEIRMAYEEFKAISKTIPANSQESLIFIERELGKGAFTSKSNLVLIEKKINHEKAGLVIKGPSKHVCLLHDSIVQTIGNCKTSYVNITDSETLSFLSRNAGKEFLTTLTDKHNVIVERDGFNDSVTSDQVQQIAHTFAAGHQIILTNLVDRIYTDILEVHLQVSEGEHDICGSPNEVYSSETAQDHVTMFIPKYKGGKTKEKERLHCALKKLLEFVQNKSITKVLFRLQEIGGWNFRMLVKQVFFSLQDYVSKGLKTPTMVYLLTPDADKYKCAEESFIRAFLDTGSQGLMFDETHFEIDETRNRAPNSGLQIDVLLKDLLEIQADAFVYATDPGLDLQKGNIASILDVYAGPLLQENLRKTYKGKNLKEWQFVTTDGYNLPYRYVVHGAIDHFENKSSLKKMQNFVYRCLENADQLRIETVVFPALGTGRCKYRAEDVVVAILEAARCFDMSYPRSYLSQIFVVANDEVTVKLMTEEINRRHDTNVFRAGKVWLRARSTKIDTVMTDCIVTFWDMNKFKSVRVNECSFLIAAGTTVSKQFMNERDGYPSGRTFRTCGGNLFSDKIVHVPLHVEESKLEYAFQDGIEKADKSSSKSCVIYFPEKSPLLNYGESTIKHLHKAIVAHSETLSNVTSIVVVFDSRCDKTFLQLFDKHCQAAAPVEKPKQISATTGMTQQAVIQTIKITGLTKNVNEATEALETKLTQLQEPQDLQRLAMEPPQEQNISRGETEVKPSEVTKDPEPKVSRHRIKMGRSFEKTIGEQKLTDPVEGNFDSRTEKTKLTNLQTERLIGKMEQSVADHEATMQVTRKDRKYFVGPGDSDRKPTRSWSPSLLELDCNDCLCIEVGQIDEIETYESLTRKIFNTEFPCPPPKLIYPFERMDKALLKCRNPKDADTLESFTDNRNHYTYRKLQPQSLQMIKVRLPRDYIIESEGKINMKKTKLEEIGILETPVSEIYINVTVFTFAQMKMLFDLLKTFEDDTVTNSLLGDSSAYKDSLHSGSRSEALYERNIEHYFTGRRLDAVPEGSHFITDDDDTKTEGEGSLSDDIVHMVEIRNGVSELLWKILSHLHANKIQVLKNKNINVLFANDCIYLDGHTDETTIEFIVKAIDQLKEMQTEEIKPTETADETKYIQWCKDTNSALEKYCCVYDDTNKSFIAFGEDYTDISKVKHQLGIKQGTIKQTGRRKNRNLDTPAPPGIPERESSPRSLSPSFPDSTVQIHSRKDFVWSRDAKEKQEYTTDEGIKIYVYIADILKLPVDCIVNAANDTLQHGGGVAWVIAKAAGSELTHEGDRFIKTSGQIPVGKACTTTAGLLPYDCVIHAVGPRWADYRPYTYRNVKECESLLQNAILSSFSEAENLSLKTIALPAISSAIFAVPEEMCAVQYAKAVINYSRGRADVAKTLKEIHFIDKNPTIISLIQKTFHRMITEKKETNYDIMNYVTERSPDTGHRNLYSTGQRRLVESLKTDDCLPVYVDTVAGCELHAKNGSKVYLYDGNILEANQKRVSSIVCADDDVGRGKGGLAKALKNKAKPFSYEADKIKAFNHQSPKPGDIVLSAGQGTGFANVYHAVLWGSSYIKDQKEIIAQAYRNILKEAELRERRPVALPILGTGSFKGISVEDSAKAFLNSYFDACKSKKSDSRMLIYLVCKDFSDKTKVKDQFRKVLERGELMPQNPARESCHGDISDKKEDGTASAETCAICRDYVSSPKTLRCGHVFCVACIDEYLNNYKKVCPTCGTVCGIIEGDQPEGKMSATVSNYRHCEGYDYCGRIDIVYDFPSGHQGREHPDPGKFYTGIRRNAYLPDNEEGREILAMLEVAFKRKLVFTIGSSRTTAKDGVITWNDIHHKTNPYPGGNFGYPDPGYLARVREELAAKGVTVNDITNLGAGDKSFRSRRR